jgi:molecular chaperone DnaK
MVKDAEANAAADKEKRALIEAKNQAESLVHEAEKNLSEHGSIIKGEDKAAIEADMQALKDVLDGSDKDAIEAKTQQLTQSLMKIGEDIYKAQQAAAAAGDETSGDSTAGDSDVKEGEILDADFEEVDGEDKKNAS